MKILVVGSCTKLKKYKHNNEPTCQDINTKNDRKKFVQKYSNFSCKASLMYKGQQHKSIIKAINLLEEISEVDYYIISAGYGLINCEEEISSYECSFSKMKNVDIIRRSNLLEIKKDFKQILESNYDLIYLALGKKYLMTISEWENLCNSLTIAFTHVKSNNFLCLDGSKHSVLKFKKQGFTIHGVFGFKGDLLEIIAKKILSLENPGEFLKNTLSNKSNFQTFINRDILK